MTPSFGPGPREGGVPVTEMATAEESRRSVLDTLGLRGLQTLKARCQVQDECTSLEFWRELWDGIEFGIWLEACFQCPSALTECSLSLLWDNLSGGQFGNISNI